MEIHPVRIEHGPVQTPTMSYSQRQPQNHRPNHGQAPSDIYKPARSPLPPAARYPYPASPQMPPQQPQPPQQPPQLSQVSASQAQRYAPGAAIFTGAYRDFRTQSQRISLLHSGDYNNATGRIREALPGGGSVGVVHLDSNQQPIKKIRLHDHKEAVQPLRIDTREAPGTYNPQVEAISPTLPDHIQLEEQTFRTTKDELIQQIGKVDREIAKAESQIIILKKKEKELEEIANKPSAKSEIEEDAQPKHQSLPQKIYAENRKKAQTAHAKLDTLGPKCDWPLYNQPSDTAVYHENKRKHVLFKKRLLDYFQRRHADKDTRQAYLTETYSKLMQEWLRKVDKIEGSTKRKGKETKNREFFEKVFPELRKQREDKESFASRFNRVGARVKSEADMEEIMDNLQEQALEDKKMRSYAVIPPILFDGKRRKLTYQDNNGFIDDMEHAYKSRQFLNIWTAGEKDVFKEKYLQHPKNFGVIASFIERKTVADCVQYYYLSKKTENYKQLLRKSRQRTRSSRNTTQKVNSSANSAVVDILTTGVTTRLQREQQARTVRDPPAEAAPPPPIAAPASTPPPVSLTAAAPTVVTTAAAPTVISSTGTGGVLATAASVVTSNAAATVQPASPKAADNATAPQSGGDSVKSFTTGGSDFGVSNQFEEFGGRGAATGKFFGEDAKGEASGAAHESVVVKKEVDSMEIVSSEPSVAASGTTVVTATSMSISENKKKKERRKDKDNANVESSDDDADVGTDKSHHGACIVCNIPLGPHLQSRPLAPTQAPQYNLREDQIPPNGRVCNTCRCKCVRSRYTHCPLPTCPNSRGRVKRLRSLPQRLQDLPPDVREPILAEFHVPGGVTKCCSACFNRIQRRLGPPEEWKDDEINQLKTLLTELGANWSAIGEKLLKGPNQIRGFYAANRKRLGLEQCLGDRKPTLTDEEESGSSTSSCDESSLLRHSSDTASAAESPPNQNQSLRGVKKEDYDSSATETADEAQTTPDHYQGSATITPVSSDGQVKSSDSLSVKDLVLNVIEFQLMKNPGGGAPPPREQPPAAPTISSILNNDTSEVTIVSEYNLNAQHQRSLAKLVTPLIGATITPVPPLQPQDDLIVVSAPPDASGETLDLSIKKPREMAQSIGSVKQHYMYQGVKSGMRQSPKTIKTGSITMGTPIQPQRYEGLLRQMPPEAKMGSITQGTPMHLPHMGGGEKRVYEYFKRGPAPPSGVQYRYPTHQGAPYPVEQQMSSRQIIMNDYLTSQQMHTRRMAAAPPPPSEKVVHYYARTPPPPQPVAAPQQQQQRQGVIQRHTRPQYLPPGHEALSSLVDVAVQQPNLPVPTAPHEGLGKTMADNIMEQPHRLHLIQAQMRQARLEEQRRAAYAAPRGRPPGDATSLTAASLIDAIITHQINQTSEGAREVPPGQRPGDILFQGFHREQPQDNGERSAPVISIDLDSGAPSSSQHQQDMKSLTVKELTDSVISHDYGARAPPPRNYHLEEEQWNRFLKNEKAKEQRQIIRMAHGAEPPGQNCHVEPVSPPENHHHWGGAPRYHQAPPPPPPPQNQHISALDYVKNRIVEVMRTEDDKKEGHEGAECDKDRSESPGDMVIDEEKEEFGGGARLDGPAHGYSYSFGQHKEAVPLGDNGRSNEPKPLLSAQYEPLSDED